MNTIITLLKQGKSVTNGSLNFHFEYDDNGETVVEVSNGTILFVDEFENKYSNLKIAA